MSTIEDVRRVVADLPRSYEVLVRDRVKFRVGQYVYLAFSHDEKTMGFAFPKEEREAMLAAHPDKFERWSKSDEPFRWLVAKLDAIDPDELAELVVDAWRMVVPKKVQAEYDARNG